MQIYVIGEASNVREYNSGHLYFDIKENNSKVSCIIFNGKNTGDGVDTGQGLAYTIATLASTPLWIRPLGSARVTGAVEGLPVLSADFDGTVIVVPGTFICFSTLTAAASGLCSITWVEVDV